jgi:hypothetical protein
MHRIGPVSKALKIAVLLFAITDTWTLDKGVRPGIEIIVYQKIDSGSFPGS